METLHARLERAEKELARFSEWQDVVSQVMVRQLTQRIKTLEELIDEKQRKTQSKPQIRRGPIRFFCEIMHRFRGYKNRGYNAIFSISKKIAQQKKKVAQ